MASRTSVRSCSEWISPFGQDRVRSQNQTRKEPAKNTNTFTSFNKWFDKCFNWFSVNDLQAPQQWGSHISACFKGNDRKIAAAYFTVIFDAVIKGNPIPYCPAFVTSGTDPRFCHIFVVITTQSCVWLKLYLFELITDFQNKYLLSADTSKRTSGPGLRGFALLTV